MAAKGWLVFLFVVLNLSNLAHPCDTQELRCQCIQISSDFIPLKFIKNVQVIPENIYCSRKEVIALLKNGKLICLDPKAEWVMALIGKITHRWFLYIMEGRQDRVLSLGTGACGKDILIVVDQKRRACPKPGSKP